MTEYTISIQKQFIVNLMNFIVNPYFRIVLYLNTEIKKTN